MAIPSLAVALAWLGLAWLFFFPFFVISVGRVNDLVWMDDGIYRVPYDRTTQHNTIGIGAGGVTITIITMLMYIHRVGI